MVVNGSKKLLKVAQKYYCIFCDYVTCKKSSFDKHLTTDKHQMVVNDSKKLLKVAQHQCHCGKIYKYDSGLYRHKKICFQQNICQNEHSSSSDKELIILLLKQQTTLVEQNCNLLEVIKNGTHVTNSNNKTFNLQFFLNETCKDAMNIMDFVDSIKLQLSDLENVGKNGYVEGISHIITSNLKALDVTQRPVHCTDKKREILYIKDENKWEKENEEKNKLKKAIKRVATKNQRLLLNFKEIHPDCIKSVSPFSDQYNKIIVESMGGSGDNDAEKETKIIKNISIATLINKD
jgi:hypothetical protein